MKNLSTNWITEKIIDFEYKKYLLLAYLQEVNKRFEETKLYPVLSDLISHYKNMMLLKENKQMLFDSFPERMRGADITNLKLFFEKIIQDDAMMQEIEGIIEYSIPQFEQYLSEGKKIYNFIEGKLYIYPIGVIPLSPSEGYFFLQNGSSKETKIYEYQITIFENPDEKYRGIHAQFISTYKKNLSTSYESIKMDLIKHYKKLPNPATYVIETEMILPLEETLIPIAKRTLVKYLAAKHE